jgi:lactate dehydrogenase-like 2-hydroxyacid dehydrogenase
VNTEDRELDKNELVEQLRDKDGVITMLVNAIDREILQEAPLLKVVANYAVGYNNIDIHAASERGIVVTNTPDVLVRALQSGQIARAGLDVFEREPKLAEGLAQLCNVVLAPHTGSATIETRNQMADLAVDNVIAVLGGKQPITPVNL